MQQYEKYKDSGIEWIGEIPAHWEMKRLWSMGRFNKGGGISRSELTDNGLPAILYGDIYTKYEYQIKDVFHRISKETANNAVEISKHTLLFTGSGETMEDIGKCVVYLNDNNAYVGGDVIILRQQQNNSLFLSYVLNSKGAQYEKARNSKGEIIVHISANQLKEILLPIPTLSEQTAIAIYLDRKTAEIDRIIANKQKLIALYEEEKKVIINQTVTKGIDPNVTLKDSGVEWLGEMPEHWEVKKLKLISHKIGDGIHTTPNYLSGNDMYFINGVNLNNGSITITDNTMSIPIEEYEKYKIELSKGALLISLNGTIGKLAIYNEEKVVFGKSAAFIELKDTIFNLYVFYLLKTQYIANYFEDSFSGTTIKNLSLYTLRNTPIPILSYQEQRAIVAHIENECARLDTIISKFTKQIDLLKEYRTTLISEVVTGKVKVADK